MESGIEKVPDKLGIVSTVLPTASYSKACIPIVTVCHRLSPGYMLHGPAFK
jgi:hypothetical protein